jgi:prevent-host-death family protein
MSKPIIVSAADANRSFSKLLRLAEQGERIRITSHGRPVAELRPLEPDPEERARFDRARADLQAHWARLAIGGPVTLGLWSRDEIYDRIQS